MHSEIEKVDSDKIQGQNLPVPYPSTSTLYNHSVPHGLLPDYFLDNSSWLCPQHTVDYSLLTYRDQNYFLLDSSACYLTKLKRCLLFHKDNKDYKGQLPRLQTVNMFWMLEALQKCRNRWPVCPRRFCIDQCVVILIYNHVRHMGCTSLGEEIKPLVSSPAEQILKHTLWIVPSFLVFFQGPTKRVIPTYFQEANWGRNYREGK